MNLLIIAALILLNGVLAMSELAVVSSRKPRLKRLADRGDKGAAAALHLAENPAELLSTIQIGITAVGIFNGAFGEATLTAPVAEFLSRWEWLAPYAKPVALALVVSVITYLSLIIGELVPKRLALHNPERIARVVAPPMRMLALIAHPLVRLLSVSSTFVLELLRSKPAADAAVSEEEIKAMMSEGAEAGVLEKAEHELMKNVFRLDDRTAAMMMTPRSEILFIDLEDDVAAQRRTLMTGQHSYYPLCRGGLDHVVGEVRARDILARELEGLPWDLAAVAHEALHVPEWLSGIEILDPLKRKVSHLCFAIDEVGGVVGLLTLHDLLEAIVGEISASPEEAWVQRPDGSWLVDGLVLADEVKEQLSLRTVPHEEERGYDTLGGMMMRGMGRVPATGDSFEWENYRFEVADMDGKRVDRVLISPLPAVEEPEGDAS